LNDLGLRFCQGSAFPGLREEHYNGKSGGVETMRGKSRRRKAPASMIAGVAVLVLGLAGCANVASSQSFDLHAPHASARASRAKFVIEAPSAASPLDGDLIVVRGMDGSLSRVPVVRWADRLPALVQSRTIQTFENAGLARQVMVFGEPGDYSLRITIRRFDIDAATRAAHVDIAARLVTAGGGRVVAAKVFTATEPVTEIAGAAPPQALDRALGVVLSQMVAWAASAAR
jgi:cholesterol transport system auxiliary component